MSKGVKIPRGINVLRPKNRFTNILYFMQIVIYLLITDSFRFLSSMAFYLDSVLNCTRVLMRVVSGWVARHLIGAVLVSLPTLAVFSHVICGIQLSIEVNSCFLFFFFF